MKYNDSDFERYLSGKMIDEEKNKFEADLLLSSELYKNFTSYKKVNELIRGTRSIKLNENYSSNILLRFRNRLEAGKKDKPFYKIGAFITAAASLVVGFTITINLLIDKNNPNPYDLAEIIESDKDAIISSFEISDNVVSKADSESLAKMDSVYNDLLSQSIYVEYDLADFNDLTNDIANIDLEQYVTDEEVDEIYTSLINKDIL